MKHEKRERNAPNLTASPLGNHTYSVSSKLVSQELICCYHREPRGHNFNAENDLKHLQSPVFILIVTDAASLDDHMKHFKAGVRN